MATNKNANKFYTEQKKAVIRDWKLVIQLINVISNTEPQMEVYPTLKRVNKHKKC